MKPVRLLHEMSSYPGPINQPQGKDLIQHKVAIVTFIVIQIPCKLEDVEVSWTGPYNQQLRTPDYYME